MPGLEERRRLFKPYYLLIGGGRNGEVVWWPRPDLEPCFFLKNEDPTKSIFRDGASHEFTNLYFPQTLVFNTPNNPEISVSYRVAGHDRYLHPALHNGIAHHLLALSLEDLSKVRCGDHG